jgi:outer membrane lipoprotein carrier protein
MKNSTILFSPSKLLFPTIALTLTIYSAPSFEVHSKEEGNTEVKSKQVVNDKVLTLTEPEITINNAKQNLMTKLSKIQYINAKFEQTVTNEEGEVLQEGQGTFAISKPNLVNWHTTEPDETLIVSNGKNLWFYDPFIDQVSLYSFNKSIANTPILLLTSEDPLLWESYQVIQHKSDRYLIHSLDVNSQVKSLELTFNGEQLTKLSILDSTGQVSHITLIEVDFITQPKASLFEFIAAEGITVDDQR